MKIVKDRELFICTVIFKVVSEKKIKLFQRNTARKGKQRKGDLTSTLKKKGLGCLAGSVGGICDS